jgi:GTP-binding protein
VQTSGRPWLLIANKAEGPERLGRVGEFHRLGAPEVIPLSALNGHGIDAALEASAVLVPQLRKGANSEPGEASPIRVAFVGRPNVGKSSLLNAILGERRFIVSEIAGTTREAVDIHVTVEGERFSLVDTAGLRRKARTTEYLDKLSAVNTLQALDRAEVAVLVLDASAGPVDQDARIAGHILERHRACVVALNKWDLVAGASKQGLGGLSGGAAHSSGSPRYGDRTPQDVQADIEHSLRFLGLAELVRVSALRGTGLRHLFRAIRTAHRHYTRMISTADLNRVVQIITRHTPPPARGRAPTKVHYGVQTGTRPPSFRLFTNHPEQVRAEYSLFMEHQLRYHFGLSGTPLKIEWSGRESSSEEVTPPRVQARRPKPAAERSKRNAGRTGRASAKSARKPQRGRSGSRPPKAGKKPLRRSKKR